MCGYNLVTGRIWVVLYMTTEPSRDFFGFLAATSVNEGDSLYRDKHDYKSSNSYPKAKASRPF